MNPRPALSGHSAFFLAVAEDEEDARTLRLGLAVALVFHLVLLWVALPDTAARLPHREERVAAVFRTQLYRAPEVHKAPVIEPRRVRVPVPDPTPDDPEPLREQLAPVSEELSLPPDHVFGIPEAPPVPEEATGPVEVGGDVAPPRRLHAPPPLYTELARRARIEGQVVLRAVIDESGAVTDLRVLAGLPLGLTESALTAVREWRFSPATRKGRPVAVYYELTVNFRLQS